MAEIVFDSCYELEIGSRHKKVKTGNRKINYIHKIEVQTTIEETGKIIGTQKKNHEV